MIGTQQVNLGLRPGTKNNGAAAKTAAPLKNLDQRPLIAPVLVFQTP